MILLAAWVLYGLVLVAFTRVVAGSVALLEELLADDAPDLVGILDGVADGQQLTADECAQVRAFRERLKAACERHNARLECSGA